jgi:hypothetical protein
MARGFKLSAKEITPAASMEALSMLMGGTAAIAKIRRFVLSMTQTTLPTAQGLEFWAQRLHSPTQNTSGTLVTSNIGQDDTGDHPSLMTAYAANTALSTGTLDLEVDDGCYLYTGRDIVWTGEILVLSGSLFRIALPNAPSGSPVVNCWVEWSEEGK